MKSNQLAYTAYKAKSQVMHVKYIHKLFGLLSFIPIYLHVIRYYIHVLLDLRGFFIDPLYLVYNFAEQETPVCIFKFHGPFGTQTELGFFWRNNFLLEGI
jgi:hypothetical protein